ncbi:ADP-ribosyl-[dinitrogen reductase] hydrolase [Cedecea neteri]|uniref:ADP-ribosyl-[dinitrogen reductase] hydrolase n=1 Tax=Cedecea neteri TaxID=158822 RepID=A0A2X3IFU2_9ENTR|nr:ADP-ribosyl-[dinitrogen reductase] hydrolase [Cedecea neteri]
MNCLPLPVTRRKKKITTFSASLAARLELALSVGKKGARHESAMEEIYQLVGTGTSTVESVPAAIAMVELAKTDPNRCAILCANLGGDTDTIGAMATAICGALNGVESIDPALKQELDEENQLDFTRYSRIFMAYRQQREASHEAK